MDKQSIDEFYTKKENEKQIDAVVVTLIKNGKIQQHWVYPIENVAPGEVNGALVDAEMKFVELLEKHCSYANDFSQEKWAEVLGAEIFQWNQDFDDVMVNAVMLAFSSKDFQ